jgi:hypothetical protein
MSKSLLKTTVFGFFVPTVQYLHDFCNINQFNVIVHNKLNMYIYELLRIEKAYKRINYD